ncbi:MAG TPA: hypothetical protein VK327_11935 [Candidatus Paceibacterota bacterium]|nr:hypothetical protein [Candidatus Paceibacterota bacterium]
MRIGIIKLLKVRIQIEHLDFAGQFGWLGAEQERRVCGIGIPRGNTIELQSARQLDRLQLGVESRGTQFQIADSDFFKTGCDGDVSVGVEFKKHFHDVSKCGIEGGKAGTPLRTDVDSVFEVCQLQLPVGDFNVVVRGLRGLFLRSQCWRDRNGHKRETDGCNRCGEKKSCIHIRLLKNPASSFTTRLPHPKSFKFFHLFRVNQ